MFAYITGIVFVIFWNCLLQELVGQFSRPGVPASLRLPLVHCVSLPPRWTIEVWYCGTWSGNWFVLTEWCWSEIIVLQCIWFGFFVILVPKLLLSCLNSMVIIAQVSFCWPTVRLQSSGLLWNIWGQLWQESASIRFPFFLMPIQCKEYLMIYEPLCCIAFHVVLLCLLCLLVC